MATKQLDHLNFDGKSEVQNVLLGANSYLQGGTAVESAMGYDSGDIKFRGTAGLLTVIDSDDITTNADWDQETTKLSDRATIKTYVDSRVQGLDPKESCRAATTGNLTLSNEQTVDGVALNAGDRVLVKNQTNGVQNGIYLVVEGGAWTRTSDFVTGTATSGAFTFIEEGTINDNSGWVLTNSDPVDVGTDVLTFSQFSGAGQISAGAGLTKSGNTLNVGAGDGIIVNADNVQIDGSQLAGENILWNAAGTNFEVDKENLAGDGLTVVGSTLAIQTGNGLSLVSDVLELGGTLTKATTLTGAGNTLAATGLGGFNLTTSAGNISLTSAGTTTVASTGNITIGDTSTANVTVGNTGVDSVLTLRSGTAGIITDANSEGIKYGSDYTTNWDDTATYDNFLATKKYVDDEVSANDWSGVIDNTDLTNAAEGIKTVATEGNYFGIRLGTFGSHNYGSITTSNSTTTASSAIAAYSDNSSIYSSVQSQVNDSNGSTTLISNNNIGLNATSYIRMNNEDITLHTQSSGGTVDFVMNSTAGGLVVSDTNWNGLQYDSLGSYALTNAAVDTWIPHKNYVDTHITGNNTDASVESPGASEDGKAITWNQTGSTWTLTDLESPLTFENGLTDTTNTVTLGGDLNDDTQISGVAGTYSFDVIETLSMNLDYVDGVEVGVLEMGGGEINLSQSSDTDYYNSLVLGNTTYLQSDDGGTSNVRIELQGHTGVSSIVFSGSTSGGFVGATYDIDYSSVFTANSLITKKYVDDTVTGGLTLSEGSLWVGAAGDVTTEVALGGTNAGMLFGQGDNTVEAHALSGDVTSTNQGVVTIANDAVTTDKINDSAVTDAKLDKLNIPLSGFGAAVANVSMGGFVLTNVAAPVANSDAVNKEYADAIAAGVVFKGACDWVTDTALPSLAAGTNGTQGSTSYDIPNAELDDAVNRKADNSEDAIAIAVDDRILIAAESNGLNGQTTATADPMNGIWVVTANTGGNYTITRALDADGTPDGEVKQGISTYVEHGDLGNANWVLLTDDPISVGDTPLSWSLMSKVGAPTAGAGLTKTGNIMSTDVEAGQGLWYNGTNGAGQPVESSQLIVKVSDLVGTGIEADGSNNFRLATQGNGISGGGGTLLSVDADSTTGATVAPVSVTSNGVGVTVDNATITHVAGELSVDFSGNADGTTIEYSTSTLSVVANDSSAPGIAGVDLSSGVGVSIDNDTITHSTGTLSVDFASHVDATTIEYTGTTLNVVAGGITATEIATDAVDDTHINWGTAGVQVAADDIPTQSYTWTQTITDGANVQTILEELDQAITDNETPPGGVDSNIQYNNSSAFGGDGEFTFNDTAKAVTLGVRTGTVGTDSMIIGNNLEASAANTFATGLDNTASGANSAVVAGTAGTVTHANSVILGGSAITSDAANTAYVENLSIKGTPTTSTDSNPTYLVQNTTTGAVEKTQLGFAGGKYSANITGTGAATQFTVTHNFNTDDVMVTVYDPTGAKEDVNVTIGRPSANSVQVTFSVAPANAKVYRVVVVG